MFKTIRQTAQELRIPEYFIRGLVAQGVCPGVRSGNRFLVHVERLQAYLNEASTPVNR